MSQHRGRWLTPVLCTLAGGFVLLLFLVALFVGGSASVGTTLSNGCSVTINSNSWAIGLESNGSTCTTRTAGKIIEIAGDVVSVNGQKLATMDSATKDVTVTIGKDDITFAADGATIVTCPR